MGKNWLNKEVDFYDFIWAKGTEACGRCINKALLDDFARGGNLFEEMGKKITEIFPTRKKAMEAFNKEN